MHETGGNVNPHSLALWTRALALHDWDAVVDVGVNYGEMLTSVELPASARVIGFEPNPRILPSLRRTLAEFGRAVTLVETALADRPDTTAQFTMDLTWSGTSGLTATLAKEDHIQELVTVPVTTLDRYFEQTTRPASLCMKVDVEGGETPFLIGAVQTLRGVTHWAVMVECVHQPIEVISQWATEHAAFVLDPLTGALLRMPSDSEALMEVRVKLAPQDLLLLSPAVASHLASERSEAELLTASVLARSPLRRRSWRRSPWLAPLRAPYRLAKRLRKRAQQRRVAAG